MTRYAASMNTVRTYGLTCTANLVCSLLDMTVLVAVLLCAFLVRIILPIA